VDRGEFLRRSAGAALALAVPPLARTRPDPRLASLARAVRGPVLAPGARGYDGARAVYDSVYASVRPLAVVQPLDAHDVRAVVRWATAHGVNAVAKSGGHSYAGYSTTTGLVVDLTRLAGVRVVAGRALIGSGARLGVIYDSLAPHGVAIPAGTCPSVGIGGHLLGGGFGLASRAWGLASDNLVSLQIVTADGRVLVADARRHPDLYWACRGGGGGNFGIVTGFTVRTHAVTGGSHFVATWSWDDVDQVVASFLRWAPYQSDALGSVCRLAGGAGQPTVQVFGQFLGAESELDAALASLGPPATRLVVGSESWLDLVRRWAGCLAHMLPQCAVPGTKRFVGASDYLSTVPSGDGLALFRQVIESRGSVSAELLLDAYGGAVNRVPSAATAFVHRAQLASIQYFASGDPVAARAWVDTSRAALAGVVSGEAYVNYVDPHLRNWAQAYYGSNLPRLRRVKQQYDPHHFFRFPQAIR
jgi:FAD/FMN-containing dehydrogenase